MHHKTGPQDSPLDSVGATAHHATTSTILWLLVPRSGELQPRCSGAAVDQGSDIGYGSGGAGEAAPDRATVLLVINGACSHSNTSGRTRAAVHNEYH